MADNKLPGPDNFEINYVSQFGGYFSSADPTNSPTNVMIRGSQNVYKISNGTIGNRFGRKQFDVVDDTLAGTKAAYVWNTSLGASRILAIANSKLEVISDIVTSGTYAHYTLMSGLTNTRGVFDPWWNNSLKKDQLIFVLGDSNLYMWHGGIGKVSSTAQVIVEAGDASNQLSAWSFTGMTTANSNNFILYYTLTDVAGTRTVNIYKDSGGSNLVATGSLVGDGVVTLVASGGSGLTGSVTVAYSGDDTTTSANTLTTTWSITLTDTIASQGFNTTSGSVLINGTTYTYTGSSGSTFTGVTPDPSGEAANSVVLSAVVTTSNTPASGFNNDFIRVIGNRLHVGSYTSRLVYISKNTDYTNFSVPGTRVAGDPELLTLDSAGKGIGVRQGQAYISAGTSDWYIISYEQITVGSTLTEQTVVQKQQTSNGAAAYAHEFIDMVDDTIVYLSQDQQLRAFGTFRNINQPAYPILSQEVSTDLQNQDFTLGQLKVIAGGDKGNIIYIIAPNTGVVYLHQTRTATDPMGNVISERLWHAPFVWGIARIDTVNGEVIGFSNSNPQVYTLWDTGQFHDDGPGKGGLTISLAYTSILLMSYKSYGRRQGKIRFDKVYWEGYMTQGTSLYGTIYYDYQGATALLAPIIHSIADNSAAPTSSFFTGVIPPSLGDASLGDNPLGDITAVIQPSGALLDSDLVPKFRIITGVEIKDCFEFALMCFTSKADDRWSLLALGANVSEAPNSPVEVIKRK